MLIPLDCSHFRLLQRGLLLSPLHRGLHVRGAVWAELSHGYPAEQGRRWKWGRDGGLCFHAQEEAEAVSHNVHELSTRGAGEGVLEDPLPGCVYEVSWKDALLDLVFIIECGIKSLKVATKNLGTGYRTQIKSRVITNFLTSRASNTVKLTVIGGMRFWGKF